MVLLLKNGVNINTKVCEKKDDNHNILTLASKYGHPEIVKLALAKGIYVNHKSLRENTALIYAASNDFIDIVNLLLQQNIRGR